MILFQRVAEAEQNRTHTECALGFVRYEYVRKLRPSEFRKLWLECVSSGYHFDDVVDVAIEKEGK